MSASEDASSVWLSKLAFSPKLPPPMRNCRRRRRLLLFPSFTNYPTIGDQDTFRMSKKRALVGVIQDDRLSSPELRLVLPPKNHHAALSEIFSSPRYTSTSLASSLPQTCLARLAMVPRVTCSYVYWSRLGGLRSQERRNLSLSLSKPDMSPFIFLNIAASV